MRFYALILCLFSSFVVHPTFAEDSEILKGLKSEDVQTRIETMHLARKISRPLEQPEIEKLLEIILEHSDYEEKETALETFTIFQTPKNISPMIVTQLLKKALHE